MYVGPTGVLVTRFTSNKSSRAGGAAGGAARSLDLVYLDGNTLAEIGEVRRTL